MNLIVAILVGGLSLFIILAALFKGSIQSKETYSVADRDIGVLPLTATLVMTEFNTATLISFSALGYLAGPKALALPAVFLIGLIFYALTVAKKWKQFNGFSVVDFFRARFGNDIGIITALFLTAAMAGFSATYLRSLTLLFSSLAPDLNYWVISGYVVLVTLAMVIKRGLVAIIKTDTLAFFVVMALLPWVLYYVFSLESNHINPPLPTNPDMLENDFLISLIPLTMFSYILSPWYGQRIFAARSERVAILSVFLSAIFVFILYAIGVLIAHQLATKGIAIEDPQKSFPHALHLTLPDVLHPVGYVVLFLISATTLTGVWNAMANIIADSLPESFHGRNNIIGITVICALATYLLSNIFVDNILNKMILANIPVIALSFTLLAGFYWPGVTKEGIYASIITGLLSGIGSYIYFGDEGIYTYYWSLIGIPLLFLAGSLISLTRTTKYKTSLIK